MEFWYGQTFQVLKKLNQPQTPEVPDRHDLMIWSLWLKLAQPLPSSKHSRRKYQQEGVCNGWHSIEWNKGLNQAAEKRERKKAGGSEAWVRRELRWMRMSRGRKTQNSRQDPELTTVWGPETRKGSRLEGLWGRKTEMCFNFLHF